MNNSNNNYYRDWPIRWNGRGEEEVKEKDDALNLHRQWSPLSTATETPPRRWLYFGGAADAQSVCDEKGQQDGNNYCEWTW